MTVKFRRIDEQRKNEPLIKDFLHSLLAFDVSSPTRTSTLTICAFLESEWVSHVYRAWSTSKEFSSHLRAPPFDRGGSSLSLFSTRVPTSRPHEETRSWQVSCSIPTLRSPAGTDFRLISWLSARNLNDSQMFCEIKREIMAL